MSGKIKKIIICAGGTGGHVFPAKRLSEMLLQDGVQVNWIGSSRGPEEKICENLGIKFYKYPLIGFRGKSYALKILSIFFGPLDADFSTEKFRFIRTMQSFEQMESLRLGHFGSSIFQAQEK